MRPGIAEQLDGIRRILADIVAPDVTAPYPREMLAGVLAALDALRSALPDLPGFLRWDIDETAAVLRAARPHLDPALAAETDAALTAAGGTDLADLDARQERLRGLLVRAVPAIDDAGGEPRRRLLDLFRQRAARYPYAISGALPRPQEARNADRA